MENLVEILRKTFLKMHFFCLSAHMLCDVFHQNIKNRSFFELRRDFWFKSFLLAQKNTIVYENIWFLIIAAHYCSLLLTFRHFQPFWSCGKSEENSWKWAVMSSKDEQWWEINYFHKLQCFSGPIKKIWIKNLPGVQKTSEIGVFACIFGEKRSSVHQKYKKKCQILSYSELH